MCIRDSIMAHGAFEVAKNYITYRYIRTLVRQSNTTDDKILSLIAVSYTHLDVYKRQVHRSSSLRLSASGRKCRASFSVSMP